MRSHPPDVTAAAPRTWWLGLFAIAFGGLVARVVYVVTVGSELDVGADATWYSLQSSIIASGSGYLDPETFFQAGRSAPTASFPPLWPALLASFDVVGVSTQEWFQVVGSIVGSATVVLTGMLGRRVVSAPVGLIAAGIVAASPAMIAADGSLMADSLAVLLIVATALVAIRAMQRATVGSFLWIGVSGGLAILTRNDSVVIVALLVAVAACNARAVGRRARVRLAAASAIALLVLAVPWALRNSVRFDQPVALSTNIGSLVEAANCETTYRGSLLGGWDKRCLHETRRPGVTEADAADAAVRRGFAHLRSEPERVPLVAATRVLRGFGLWNPFSQVPLEVEETRDETWQLAAWAFSILVLVFGVAGLVALGRRDWRRMLPLAAMVGGVVLVIVLSWGNPRFRLPAEPALAVGASAALWALLRRAPVDVSPFGAGGAGSGLRAMLPG